MKNFILSICACLFVMLLSSCGGSDSKYLEFQGVPMTGTNETFAKQLETKGYKFIQKSEDESVYLMQGPYWHYDDLYVQFHIADDNSMDDQSVVAVFIDGKGNLDDVCSDLHGDIYNKYFPQDLAPAVLYSTNRQLEIKLDNGSITLNKIGGAVKMGFLQGVTELRVVYSALNTVQKKAKDEQEKQIKDRNSNL